MKNYASEPYQFQIADKTFVIQELGFSDIEKAQKIGDLLSQDVQKGVDAIQELIRGKADKRTADAVMGLPPRKILEFIKDWVGLTPGESSTSGDA